jgi:hypothetical protein
VYYNITELKTSTVDIRYLFNINQPNEMDFNYVQNFGTFGDDLNLAIKFENIENTIWIPEESYIKSRRNTVTVFNDLRIPCFSELYL